MATDLVPPARSGVWWYFWLDVRRPRVVARTALIAVFASVAVPGTVGNWAQHPFPTPSGDLYSAFELVASVRGTALTTAPLDPAFRSDGALDPGSSLLEPTQRTEPPQARLPAAQIDPTPGRVARYPWHRDPNVSWYGPGFYGKRTACGIAMTTSLVGVAHRTLPCGTLVAFRDPGTGRTVVAPVVDRGPYVSGRTWDLTGALCTKLGHCYTGPIAWRIVPRG